MRVRVRVWIRIGVGIRIGIEIGIGIGIGIDASTVVCRESGGGIILNENKRCHHSPQVNQQMRQDSVYNSVYMVRGTLWCVVCGEILGLLSDAW